MPSVLPRLAAIAAAATVALLSTAVHAQQARGVNPADIDSRADLIVKRVNLDPAGTTEVVTVKYDHKLTSSWGLNFELPVYNRLRIPGFSATGNGDLFARARYIVPAGGGWTVGGALEAVLPTASDDALGGRPQLNVGLLAVKPVSRGFIAAFAAKQVMSVGGSDRFPQVRNTELRFVPVLILADGWAVTGDVRQTWEHSGDRSWQRLEATLNKQFTPQWAGSLSVSHDFGDRPDRGAVSAAVKYFF